MTARARSTDPATSHEAADSLDGLTLKRRAVLYVFRDGNGNGLTDEEMIARYDALSRRYPILYPPQSVSGLRTRRHELVELGRLIDSGEKRLTVSRRRSIVWSIPPMLPGEQGRLAL